METATAAAFGQAGPLERRSQLLARVTLACGRWIETQHAQRQRDAAPYLSFADIDQLKAAAAKVTHDAISIGDCGKHALAGQSGFLFSAQHLAAESDVVDISNELSAVLRI